MTEPVSSLNPLVSTIALLECSPQDRAGRGHSHWSLTHDNKGTFRKRKEG